MISTLMSQLRDLRLSAMAHALETQCSQPHTYAELGFEERLGLLIEQELTEREQRKQHRLKSRAQLKLPARFQDIDYGSARGLTKSQMASLQTGQWITHHHNLLLTGPTGSGKSFLACALGDLACQRGYTVRYYRTSRLLEALTLAHGDGSFTKLLRQLKTVQVLILDDFGLDAITPTQRHDLLEVMDDRHGFNSTVVASQLPIAQWHATLGDATLADAILDRLIHNAHRITLRGESLRKRLTPEDDL